MSYSFSTGNPYLLLSSVPVSNTPLTMACWFYNNTAPNTNDHCMMQIQDEASGGMYFRMGVIDNAPTTNGVVALVNNGSFDYAYSADYTQNTWQHAAAVFGSSTSRFAYLDGSPGSENTTSLTDPTGLDSIAIGRELDQTPADSWSGFLAECAVWNVALTTAEIQILAKGFSPLFVRPSNLAFYAPLVANAIELIGGTPLTVSAATVAAHPRIIYPRRRWLHSVPAAAPAVSGAASRMLLMGVG